MVLSCRYCSGGAESRIPTPAAGGTQLAYPILPPTCQTLCSSCFTYFRTLFCPIPYTMPPSLSALAFYRGWQGVMALPRHIRLDSIILQTRTFFWVSTPPLVDLQQLRQATGSITRRGISLPLPTATLGAGSGNSSVVPLPIASQQLEVYTNFTITYPSDLPVSRLPALGLRLKGSAGRDTGKNMDGLEGLRPGCSSLFTAVMVASCTTGGSAAGDALDAVLRVERACSGSVGE